MVLKEVLKDDLVEEFQKFSDRMAMMMREHSVDTEEGGTCLNPSHLH